MTDKLAYDMKIVCKGCEKECSAGFVENGYTAIKLWMEEISGCEHAKVNAYDGIAR